MDHTECNINTGPNIYSTIVFEQSMLIVCLHGRKKKITEIRIEKDKVVDARMCSMHFK